MKLAIDPGHGMGNVRRGVFDPGAVAGPFQEARIATEWAIAGRWIGQRFGVDVWLSREGDGENYPLGQRPVRARAAGCDRLLSIHCNSANGLGVASGVEVFYRDDADKEWATLVLKALVNATGLRSRGVKHESQSARKKLAILGFAGGPACLAEIGFIDSQRDQIVISARDTRMIFWEEIYSLLGFQLRQ